ncbi:MAG TPA: histidinol-phosphate transaminase [Spirochaetota bacterium]|mgnify:CR=1 FL=1|nr:histidinol-phosphate transaminase [Spirochaetota bacterium]HPH01757.1 histidinol-phosphate transaminase [Spirochaetota bacterium]HPN82586.1 histidinol-phosphate transaminase [Spirochaetota bacterium]
MKTRYWNERLRGMAAYTPGFQPPIKAETIKLNTNENPWPPSPLAIQAMVESIGSELRLYPPSAWVELRAAISETYGIGSDRIFCGNGSDEILSLVFRCFTDPGDSLLLPWPTYSLYPVLAAAAGCTVEYVETKDDFTIDLDTMLGRKARIAILTNPNAPTGILAPPEGLLDFADRFEGLVVIDEAYIDFAPEGSSTLAGLGTRENVIILRTFSKSFSLCGIRCGYAFAAPGLVEGLVAMKDSYNLDLVAQRGATAAIRDIAWMKENAARIVATRRDFVIALESMGCRVLPSDANFIFMQHGSVPAGLIQQMLAEQDIHVRHFSGKRVADWVRISIGTDDEMQRVRTVLARVLAGA